MELATSSHGQQVDSKKGSGGNMELATPHGQQVETTKKDTGM